MAALVAAAYALPWCVWITRIGDDHGWWSWHVPGGQPLKHPEAL
jgi:hypothetical protein